MNFGDVETESCLFVFDELHIKTEPWTPRENNDQCVKQKHVKVFLTVKCVAFPTCCQKDKIIPCNLDLNKTRPEP